MMTTRNAFLVPAAGFSILLVTSTVLAQVVSLTPSVVDNSAGGAELTNFVTTDIKIDFTGQYTGAQAWIQLTAGSIYQDPAGSVLPPSAADVGATPSLGFDTFVAQGSDRADGPWGNPLPGGGAVDLGGPPVAVFNTETINQAWNSIEHPYDHSDFLFGRFTLSKDALGSAKFLASAGGDPKTFDFRIQNGTLCVDCLPYEGPFVALHQLGEREPSEGVISATAMTTQGEPPISWSGLTSTLGSPTIAATLDVDGNFSWDPAGSPAGKKGSGQVKYQWTATATNTFGSHTDIAFEVILIPEPATMSLFGLAVAAYVGMLRRRGQSHQATT
jgi:hypothetical protein